MAIGCTAIVHKDGHPFKLEEVCDNRPTVDFKVSKGQMNNTLNSKHKIPPGLFGTPTETKVT